MLTLIINKILNLIKNWTGLNANSCSFCRKILHYIIFAIMAGYILFETIPVPRTFLGAAIIIGAGVYIYFREKVRGQMIASDTPNR